MESASSGPQWQSYCAQEDSILTYLFSGQLKRRTICFACQHISEYHEPFDILPLASGDKNQTLDDVLQLNFQPELIDEAFYCSACNKKVPAASKIVLSQLPPYLIVQLKRFQTFPKASKLTHEVWCSPDGMLDLSR